MKHERMDPSFITTPKGEKLVVITAAEYAFLKATAEDRADLLAANAAMAAIKSGEDEMVPGELVDRLFNGVSPLRVWREFRGMTAKDLATASGLSAAYVSQIESGKRDGTVGAFRKMSKALRVSMSDLLWEAPAKPKRRAKKKTG